MSCFFIEDPRKKVRPERGGVVWLDFGRFAPLAARPDGAAAVGAFGFSTNGPHGASSGVRGLARADVDS
jgi:hypothetical protein